MKVMSVVAACLLMMGIGARGANADALCSLTVGPSSYVPRGASYYYDANMPGMPNPGPMPPGGYSRPTTLWFLGEKDGVADIPDGEYHAGPFTYGHTYFTGYQNPTTGDYGGTYLRWFVAYDQYGHVYCQSNIVAVVLQT